jgi:hypothetical protein
MRMELTWVSMVFAETTSDSAMERLDAPVAINVDAACNRAARQYRRGR